MIKIPFVLYSDIILNIYLDREQLTVLIHIYIHLYCHQQFQQ